jgi:methyl-accepting chemotaxis protein
MKWFKNLNAVPKIMAAFGGVLFFLLPIGYLAITQISQLSELNSQIFNRDVGGIDAIKQAEVDQALMSRTLAMAALSQGNLAGVALAEQDFQSLMIDLRSSLDSAYSRSIRANLRDQLQLATSMIPNGERISQEVFARAKAGDSAATAASLKSAWLAADQLRELLHQASVMKKANVLLFKADELSAINRARTQFGWLVFAVVAFGSLASFTIARSFSVPLKQAVSMLGEVERGDLTQRLHIESRDEIGQFAKALNSALDNVRDVIMQVGEASRTLTSASSQLAKSSDVLASGAHEQAASLEQTSASLEEITATIRQNSDNARQASQFAMSSRDSAEKGGAVVHSAMDAMTEINDASAKIAAIIRVIDEIAFQTNLLAVNASVEAARAREHGKGFAVVATEVRSLAQRSGSAAKEIKALIADSRRKVENGSTLVNRSGQTLSTIVASVKRVTDIVSEIAAASREQSTGIEQVNTAMMQMDRVMQSNSSQTEQLSATANTLAANAAQLEQLLSRFVVKTDAPGAKVPEPKLRTSRTEATARTSARPSAADTAVATTTSLDNLASNLGRQISTAALDEEFEEF